MASDDHIEKSEAADCALSGDEECREKPAVGVVDGGQKAAGRVVWPEPVVRASVPLDHHAAHGLAWPAGVVSGRPALPLGRFPRTPEDSADRLAADGDTFSGSEHFGEVAVIEVGIDVLVKVDDPPDEVAGQGVLYGAPPVPVDQSGGSELKITLLEPLDLAVAHIKDHCGLPECRPPVDHVLQDPGATELLLAHENLALHAALLPLHEGDIFSLQLLGT